MNRAVRITISVNFHNPLSLVAVYTSSDPIAGGSWSASKDVLSQVSWQNAIGSIMDNSDIFSAGVYFGVGSFSIQGLARSEGNALPYVRDFSSHNYPQSASTANLQALMSHSNIASQISQFKAEAASARASGKPYVMGETNSGTHEEPRVCRLRIANPGCSYWRRRRH